MRRKLLILARAAGVALEASEIEVDSLVPQTLADADDIDAALASLDAPLLQRLRDANGQRLHFVARWHAGVARVGLEALAANDPLAAGSGTDNRVAIHSARYATQPLVIQGPGAGAEVTAAAMLDDVFALRDSRLAKNASIGWGRAIA